jgi:SAM-dependent methyltransferase
MLSFLRRQARQSKSAIICHKVYRNWRMRSVYSKGVIDESIGSTHSYKSLDESLAYIDHQYSDYLTYANLKPGELEGKRVLEIGFGDNVGVALKFLSDGAAEVVCVDKFYSTRDLENERQIYLRQRERLQPAQRDRFDQIVSLEDKIRIDEQRLRCVYGCELPELATREGVGSFDLIVSRAVIEEIYDPRPLFVAADNLLRPGGISIHKIDLSDYKMFSDAGMNPLTFLTIPEWLYKKMASSSGLPNRKLISYYRDLMRELGYDTTVFTSNIIGLGDLYTYKEQIRLHQDYSERELKFVKDIRPKLAEPFSSLSDEELLISGIFIVGRKPLQGF